jgi:DNA-binding HxlR family transcriptional regulator
LYPYGVGGIEHDRPVQLSLNDHARWSLEYHDRRFRYHHSFIFTVFGIQHKWQGMILCKIQMKQRSFDNIAQTLSTITLANLRRAAEEQGRGEKPSNPVVQVLSRHVTATSRRVMASGPNCTQLWSQIYLATIYFNQPTVWLTINPDDGNLSVCAGMPE